MSLGGKDIDEMNFEDFLRVRTKLNQKEKSVVEEIHDKVLSTIQESEKAQLYISTILNWLYKGFSINRKHYLKSVFFDFHIIKQKTKYHEARIYKQLEKIENIAKDSREEQMHLVNIYRNIVSDLFDPAINLLVATIQFIEGDFQDIQKTNLGMQERNKYQYTFKRLKPTNLFDGYNPIVRNAISHAGTEGIIYETDAVVFRNIRRGPSPQVSSVKWSNEKLRKKILQLLNFIHAIDGATEIFGFDVSKIIKNDKDLSHKFLDEVTTRGQRLELQEEFKSQIKKITDSKSLDDKSKLEALTNIYFIECKKRKIPVESVKFNDSDKFVEIEVPLPPIDSSVDSEVINRSLKLIRYGIIGIHLYEFKFESFLIRETKVKDSDCLAVKLRGEDLIKYGLEEVGLYDLLNDSDIFINN